MYNIERAVLKKKLYHSIVLWQRTGDIGRYSPQESKTRVTTIERGRAIGAASKS